MDTSAQESPLPPNVPQFDAEPARKPRRKSGVFGFLLLLLLIGGGVWAYISGWLPFSQNLSSDQVIGRMLDSVLDIKSAEYELKFAFKSEQREAGAIPWASELPDFEEKKQSIKRDQKRLSDLRSLHSAISSYFKKHGRDPLALSNLVEENSRNGEYITDPKTGQPYGYRQEAGGADFVLHVQLETDAALAAYTKAFEGKVEKPLIKPERVIEITKDTPSVYARVDFSDVAPYPIGFDFNELYQYLPSEIDAALSLAGQSQSDISKTNDAAHSIDGRLALGGTTFNAGADLRKKSEEYYLQILEAPSLGFFDLAALKQKWIKIVPQDAYGTFLGEWLYRSGEESVEERSARLLRQYQLILQLLQEEDVLQVVQEFPKTAEGEANLYHYQVRLDREKFAPFYQRLTDTMKEEFGDKAIIEFREETLQYLESPEFAQFYSALDRNVVLELWVDDQDFWPRRFAYAARLVPPDSVLKLKDKQYRFSLTVGLDKINDPIAVEVPSPTISVDEARTLLTGETIQEVRLSRQQDQIEALRDALATYKAANGAYPNELAALLENHTDDEPFLQVMLHDVYTNQPYTYTGSGTSYELKYMVQLPPAREDSINDFASNYSKETFVEGMNTSTPQKLSVEGDSEGMKPSVQNDSISAVRSAQEQSNTARIKSSVAQLRTLAEVYYDNNTSSYQGFDQCIDSPAIGSCKAEAIVSGISSLKSDLIKTYGSAALSVNAVKNQYCVSHPLPNNNHSCLDSTGTFFEGKVATCGTVATLCPR